MLPLNIRYVLLWWCDHSLLQSVIIPYHIKRNGQEILLTIWTLISRRWRLECCSIRVLYRKQTTRCALPIVWVVYSIHSSTLFRQILWLITMILITIGLFLLFRWLIGRSDSLLCYPVFSKITILSILNPFSSLSDSLLLLPCVSISMVDPTILLSESVIHRPILPTSWKLTIFVIRSPATLLSIPIIPDSIWIPNDTSTIIIPKA